MSLPKLYILAAVLPLFVQAQLPQGVTHDLENGLYKVRFQDSLTQMIYTWEFVPATKIHPFVHADIKFDTQTELFSYEYKLMNGKNSQQNLTEFSLQYNGPYSRQGLPSRSWELKRYFNLPLMGWTAVTALDKPEKSGIKPGSDVEGFILTTPGLPVIVPCYFSGYSPSRKIPDGLPVEMKEFFKNMLKFPENMVKRWTIGPSTNIGEEPVTAIIDSLKRMTDQAFSMEWIRIVRIYSEITSTLSEVKTLIQIESTTPALNKLKRLLKNLEKYRGDTLREEVYILLYYHVRNMENRLRR